MILSEPKQGSERLEFELRSLFPEGHADII